MQFLTHRPRRPAVRLAGLHPSASPTAPADRDPSTRPPAGAETLGAGAGTVDGRPGELTPGGLTEAERVLVEDVFRQASRLSQVCKGLLAVALLALLVVLMS